MRKPMVVLVSALLLGLPSVAGAQGENPDVAPDVSDESGAEIDEEQPWEIAGSATVYAYQGLWTSVANDTEYAGEIDDGSGAFNLAVLSATIDPSYQWNDFVFAGQIGYIQYLTAAGGFNQPYEGRFQDIELSASHRGYTHEATGLNIAPTVSVELPSSARSRAMTMIVGSSVGLQFSRHFFDRLTLGYGIRGSRTFHEYTSPVMSIEEVGEANALYRSDGAEAVEPGRFAVAGVNTPWGLVHSLSAQLSISENLDASIGYGLSTGWSYDVARDDEYASEYQCTGRCAGRSANGRSAQLASGSVALNYTMHDHLSLSAGLSSVQPPKKPDNQRYNFPFWNFSSPAANYSSVSVGVTGRY